MITNTHSTDIILINPSLAAVSTTSFFVMPPNLIALATYVNERGFSAQILDCNTIKDKQSFNSFITNALDQNIKLVGASIMVAGQLPEARAALTLVKKVFPHIITVVGGAHASQFPEEILKNCPEIDFVVIGEGEKQLLFCAKFASNPIKEPWPDGIAYRKETNIIVYPKKSYIKNINLLPLPDYTLLDFSQYAHDTSSWHNPYNNDLSIRVPIITSRGCPNICNFCSVAKCMGLPHRALRPEKVVTIMETIQKNTGSSYFAIYDANFTEDPKRVISICNEIAKRNLKFILDLPTGFPINAFATEMIDALVSVGLIRTGVSVESGDDYIRNQVMKKNIKRDDIFTVIDYVRKYKHVFFLADIVIGMPEDTLESLEASLNIIRKLDVDDIVLSIATPYPGTPLYAQCIENNLFFSEIDKNRLWNATWYSHDNLDKFVIKPYSIDIDTLIEYKNKILQERDKKVQSYHKRMKDLFNVESKYSSRS